MKTTLLLILAIISLTAEASDKLTIYLSPPDKAIDWSSPGTLYRSLILSRLSLTKRPFGSAVAVLECQNEKKGFSVDPESFDVMAPVVFGGRGLGHLYSAHPGKLLSSEEALKKADSASVNFSFLITQKHCNRILSYVEEFKKYNVAKNFGLPHRPLMAEGATDTSFIVSLLEISGLINPHQDLAWERVLYLPKELSGSPLTDNYVSIFKVMKGTWGKGLKDSFVLKFWDPELMIDWVKKDPSRKELDRLISPVPIGTFWEQATDPTYHKKTTSP